MLTPPDYPTNPFEAFRPGNILLVALGFAAIAVPCWLLLIEFS